MRGLDSPHIGSPAAQQPLLELLTDLHDRVAQPLAAAAAVVGLTGLSELDRQRAAHAVTCAQRELTAVLVRSTDAIELADTWPTDAGAESRLERVVRAVVGEALANVRKHADARQVSITVSNGEGEGIELEVANDGVRAARGARSGLGLRLAGARLHSIAGRLETSAAQDGWWRLRACL
jgi:two-component system, NarL family, sensor histidine kinase DesK